MTDCDVRQQETWLGSNVGWECLNTLTDHLYTYIYIYKKLSTKCDISSCQQLTMVKGCKDVSNKTENAVLIMAKKRCIA